MEKVARKDLDDRIGFRIRRGLGSHVAGLPLLEHETVQLGSGNGTFVTRQALGRDVAIFQTRISPKLIGHVCLDPRWMVFMLPLSWQGDYLFNGVTARPHDVFMACEPTGYTTVAEDRDTLAIGVRKTKLVRTARSLSGGAQIPRLQDRRLELNIAQSIHLQTRAMTAMQSAASSPLGIGRFILPLAVESDLISLLSVLMLRQRPFCKARDPGRLQPRDVVHAALRADDARQGLNVSLAELCEASGVSHTWLARCFQEVYGTSPVAYLRARRLSEARARLLDRAAPPASVKEVALSLGFTHLGRFAADYQARFEEKPSDSLRLVTRD